MQVVFQDPFASLSPRLTVGQIVGEGLALHRADLSAAEREKMVLAMLDEVGLSERHGVADQERTLLHDAMSRAINRTVKRNLARTIRVTEVDDDDWNQMIRKYEEV
jgi:ABC-type glutathione transport system ATPase component